MDIFTEVKQAVNIKDVISFYGIKVDRRGKFICPFHDDTHPSANIKNDYFHCFVCGAGGDCIKFVARLHGLSNFAAAEKIVQDFGLPIVTRPVTLADKLRADRARQKMRTGQQERERVEDLTAETGCILADFFRYLWRARNAPYDTPEFERSARYLDYAQNALDEYESAPEQWSAARKEEVRRIASRISEWDK